MSLDNTNQRVLLIGTGYMAREYVNVLKSLSVNFIVVGHSEKSVSEFNKDTGIQAISGGIKKYLESFVTPPNCSAIVAVNADELFNITKLLIEHGIKNILSEKPGGITRKEIESLVNLSKEHYCNIYVAYNRRNYASTEKALDIIRDDGGVLSFNFEFTEWSHIIRNLKKSDLIKNNWLLLNSTHVIDLAFFVGGLPKKMESFSEYKSDWSKESAVYSGAGVTEDGALFTYNANWIAPGRWGVEWLTSKHKLILRPLEKLQIQELGSVDIKYVDINDELDVKYKPGLYKEVSGFLGFDDTEKRKLKSINEQLCMMNIYEKIAGHKY